MDTSILVPPSPLFFAFVAIAGWAIWRNRASSRSERHRERREVDRLREHLLRVQEDERARFAHELHDEASQAITAVLLALCGLEERVGQDIRIEMLRVREELRAVLMNLKRIARGLHPSLLEDLGLIAALGELVDELRERHGMEAELVAVGVDEASRLARPVELALYRIAQESVANVLRHSGAHSVSVVVERIGPVVRMVVEDDGKGFDVGRTMQREGPSVGLHFMRERAELMGGSVETESHPGRGASVHVTLPLAERVP